MEFRSLTAVTHISHESVPKSRFMTASPSREKPLVEIFTGYDRTPCVGHGTRLLPSGRHPRVASLAPSGQFTSGWPVGPGDCALRRVRRATAEGGS